VTKIYEPKLYVPPLIPCTLTFYLFFFFQKFWIYEEPIFWDITPCNPLKVNRQFGGTCHLRLQGRRINQLWALLATCLILVSCLAYSSTLKMEATCSSEKSIWLQRTTWHYIPQDRSLHNHRCENLKSCNLKFMSHSFILGKLGAERCYIPKLHQKYFIRKTDTSN
jgi:hypothetical protein